MVKKYKKIDKQEVTHDVMSGNTLLCVVHVEDVGSS